MAWRGSLITQALALLLFCSLQLEAERASPPTRVGLLVQGPPIKGIFRDAEIVAWALGGAPLRVSGGGIASLSVFYTGNYAMLDTAVQMGAQCIEDALGRSLCQTSAAMAEGDSAIMEPLLVKEGTQLGAWMSSINVLIVMESALENVFSLAHKQGVGTKIILLNLEWSDPQQLSRLSKSVPGVKLAAKGQAAMHIMSSELQMIGSSAHIELVPWSIPDNVVRMRKARTEGTLRLLFVAGLGGIRNRRGGDIVLESYRRLLEMMPRQKDGTASILLEYYSARHPESYDIPVAKELLHQEGLQLHIGPFARRVIEDALSQADLLLYPSRWEGFGLSLLEALHAGLPVAATNGWPMNELVEDGHNGILIPATAMQPGFGLSPTWEVAPLDLAAAIARFAADPELRARTTCPSASELISRQHRFVLSLRKMVLSERATPVLLSFFAGLHPQYPRAELFRSEALRHLGYEVLDIPYDKLLDQQVVAAVKSADLLLISKPPSVEWVRELKGLRGNVPPPIFMWFWDPIDYSPDRRKWFIEVGQECDASFVNEKGREAEWSALGIPNVHYIEEGCMHLGDRGMGKRPKKLPPPGTLHDVSFQGTVYPFPPDFPRVEVLLHLLKHRADLSVYGPHHEWAALNITSLPPSYGQQSHLIHRQSKVTLSLSRLQPGTELYRSERLMDGAGAGGCVLSEVFPGLDLLLPEKSVLVANTPSEYLKVVEEIAAHPELCALKREDAMRAVWSFHTWQDSAIRFMSLIRSPDLFAFKEHGHGGRQPSSCARPATAGASCCGNGNYNMRHGRLLLHGKTPWHPRHTVEASIFLSGAIQDCPSNSEAWKEMAGALFVHGDRKRSIRSYVTMRRVLGGSIVQTARDDPYSSIAWMSNNFGPWVSQPVKTICSDVANASPAYQSHCSTLLEILDSVRLGLQRLDN